MISTRTWGKSGPTTPSWTRSSARLSRWSSGTRSRLSCALVSTLKSQVSAKRRRHSPLLPTTSVCGTLGAVLSATVWSIRACLAISYVSYSQPCPFSSWCTWSHPLSTATSTTSSTWTTNGRVSTTSMVPTDSPWSISPSLDWLDCSNQKCCSQNLSHTYILALASSLS